MPEGNAHQASGLAGVRQQKPVQVVTVASGKGGVGKTNVSVNLATARALMGKKVWLFDADLGLANVDVLLGLSPELNLSHVLAGECDLADIVLKGPADLRIVPASSGVQHMASLSDAECRGLIHAFSDLTDDIDMLIVDTAAGISTSVTMFAQAAHEVLVVVCDEPASITDAYALIKVLSRDHGVQRARVVANMVRSSAEGLALYRKIAKVTDRYLETVLQYAGCIPHDDFLRRALQRQQPVVTAFPSSRSALAFKKLAESVDQWALPSRGSGNLEFFFERVLGAQGAFQERR